MPFLVESSRGVAAPALGLSGQLGHDFERAPDGNEYFTVLGPSINLVFAVRDLRRAQSNYLRMPGGRGRDQAAAMEVIIRELETAVHRSGVATAEFAEERAKSLLERRIVRPSTPGPDHLKDSIVARPIVMRGLPGSWGAVGIGDISLLDRHEYWKAQEFGSTHLVGEELRGFFFNPGGPHRPNPAQFREHAVFGSTGEKGPPMRVENPIQGKAFLTEATFDALAFRFRAWRSIESAAVAQVRSVRVATAGDLAGQRYSRTVGGFAALARYRPGSASRLPMSFRL